MFITIENLNKKFYESVIFEEANYVINEHDKIGVIGVNGTGKSTLLKMIAKIEDVDSGKINLRNGLKISYLSQDQNFDDNKTIKEVALDELLKLDP